MNFYKHHIGDYDQATRHLSFIEDAAYSRLIRKYYAEERPLPADLKQVQRLVGAREKAEKEAVAAVLEEFFELQEDGWHNKRCDEELAKANKQAETNRQIALEREARKRARQVNEHSTIRDGKQHESLSQEEHESCVSREPSQTPDTRHQTPDLTSSAPSEKISLGAGGWEHVPDDLLRQWRTAFPAVSIDGELAKAAAWLIANPKNRKSNYARFLTNWLTRAQDRAPRANGNRSSGGADEIWG